MRWQRGMRCCDGKPVLSSLCCTTGHGDRGNSATPLTQSPALWRQVISKRKLSTPEEIDDVKREVQIMHHLAGHPNVVNLKAGGAAPATGGTGSGLP